MITLLLQRFLPDGKVDDEFRTVRFDRPNVDVHAHAFLGDGKLLIGGEFSDIGGIQR